MSSLRDDDVGNGRVTISHETAARQEVGSVWHCMQELRFLSE